jgi:hypothetical protein
MLLVCCDQRPRPTAKEINLIERSVSLPKGAGPLSSYQRFYRYETQYGKKGIGGDYFLKGMIPRLHDRIVLPWDDLPASAHSVPEGVGPIVSDGGCGHIGIFFNFSTKATRAICAFPYTDFRKVSLGAQPCVRCVMKVRSPTP